MVMTLSMQFRLNVIQFQQQLLYLLDVEALGIVGGVVIEGRNFFFPIAEVLAVVEIAVVGRHAVVAAPIFGMRHLFARQERLVKLFAMPRTDDVDGIVLLEQLPQCLREIADGGRGRLLDKNVALVAMFVGIQDQVTESSSDIRKRVMLGSVSVSGLPSFSCEMKSGITDPRDAMTLP
jgi:hypothetical protein